MTNWHIKRPTNGNEENDEWKNNIILSKKSWIHVISNCGRELFRQNIEIYWNDDFIIEYEPTNVSMFIIHIKVNVPVHRVICV